LARRDFHSTRGGRSWEEVNAFLVENWQSVKSILEAVGSGAIGAFTMYQYAIRDKRTYRSTYVQSVKSTLLRQYTAPKFKVDLPLIHRSNENDLKKVIDSSGLFLLVGPSNSGKSSYFQQLVNGRRATVYVSGKEIGTTKQELLEALADAFGFGTVEASSRKDITLQGLLGMIKEALQLLPAEKLSPLFILDDVQKFCKDGVVKSDAADFLTWCQEMTNLSLLNFIMISSDRQAIEPVQNLSGFSARLKVIEMPYVDGTALKTLLQNAPTEMHIPGPPPSILRATLSESEANYVVDRLGGHMGDIAEFLDQRRAGISVEDAVNSIVAASVSRLSNVFFQRPPEFEERVWNEVARSFFECLSSHTDKTVSLVLAKNHAAKSIADVQIADVEAVARSLSRSNILRFVDFKTVGFHRPVYSPAFCALKNEELFKEKFS